jgi:enoyl-CoA hydratase/carnithine racemase
MSVTLERRGNVAVITLNRPEAANAVNRAVRAGLRTAFDEFKADDSLRVGVITGAGRNFCSGADLREMLEDTESGQSDGYLSQDYLRDFETDLSLHKPLIAAINGPCIGMGFTIALSCDMRVASRNAFFSYPEGQRGLPTIVGSLKLTRVVSLSDAMEIMLIGDPISAERAHELRILNRLVDEGQALDTAMAMAEKLAKNAPLATYAMKEIMLRGYDLPFADAVRLGEGLRSAVRQSADFLEGLRAFREKRDPDYQGR